MAERPLLAIDASAALKWHLRDETDSAPAVQLLDDYTAGRVNLIAPQHFPYEVGSGIRGAVLGRRIDRVDGRGLMRDFMALGIPTTHQDSLMELSWDFWQRYSCSFYDGIYVAVAQVFHTRLVTGDNKLVNALGQNHPLLIPISTYTTPPLH